MFRILIVEDDPITLSSMQGLLHEALLDPDNHTPTRIDTAENVQSARRLIESAVVAKRPYQAVVLDTMLPNQPGLPIEFDESLCDTIYALMPSALIAHITAFQHDEQVRRHVQKRHTELVDKSIVLSKSHDFGQVLCDKLKAFLFGQQVEEQMDQMFKRAEADAEQIIRLRQRPRGTGSLTHELAALCRDIARHWNDLDERCRARVRTVFYIDDTKEPVRVSLLHPGSQLDPKLRPGE